MRVAAIDDDEDVRPPDVRRVRTALHEAAKLRKAARTLLADDERARAEVERALAEARAVSARRDLGEMPISRLRDVTDGRLLLGPLEQAGFTTVLDVLGRSPYTLELVPGLGARSARQVYAAAKQIERAVAEAGAVRIDVDEHDPATTALLIALKRLVNAGPDLPRALTLATAIQDRLPALTAAARPARSRLRMLLAGREGRRRAREAALEIERLLAEANAAEAPLLMAQATVDLLRPVDDELEAWADFAVQAPEYHELLAEVAGLRADEAAAEGFLPEEIASAVKEHPLDDRHLRVRLRGYQSFGARFALVQRKVILGDEMGLGKTITAIAALAHLKAEGRTHFLVACPASVLINWLREVERRSTLRAYPLHGPDRADAFADWIRDGGVAVTTFAMLHRLGHPGEIALGLLVVDEAHYVKNPGAKRSQAVARWIAHAERVLFLSGTPMENRVEEFRSLVRHLRPDLASTISVADGVAGAAAFRRAVAPVYLRRNRQDVLTELPDLVRVDEWEEFGQADLEAYRKAVAAGNFMAMRRAAYAVPARSAKLRRLAELVEKAADNGLKVIVFSFFRDVLAAVGDALGPRVLGPISGELSVVRRQQLVDEFSAASGHAVLLAQIEAGGVGLNLHAASVVIFCEPQVTPAMESQAIARAHRMGQVRKVQVHRLLTPDSVDERMLEILSRKTTLFDAYARRSELAEAAPEAIDISEQALARTIVEAERRRLTGPAPETIAAP
ncbi:DEAD/DEAH box helicase [Thermopolyspora sp. NPDC052614]|uniref:DEAD/DEAH box helicase n=1 Tax=Thermopolyspora sp. NPDC052614 TaxID=3155682 RepID=UPI00342D9E1D